MSNPKDIPNGGPVFPVPMVPWQAGFINVECTGMTLRDYFAAHAPHDALGLPIKVEEAAARLGIPAANYRAEHHWHQVVAQARYVFADAMMKARGG